MFRLDGKVALVSGGGRGMGFGIAQGAHVVVNDFHQDRAESAARQLREAGLKASVQAADLTDRAAIFAMVERIRDEVGVVDIFVHNAGIPAQGWGYTPFLQSPESEWNAWLQLNLHGLMHACQALVPAMQQKGWGRIAAINSDAARTATGMGLCAYGAAKAAAVGFIRKSLGRSGPARRDGQRCVAGHHEQLGRLGEDRQKRHFRGPGRIAPGCGCGRELSGIDRSAMGQRPGAAGQRRWSGGLSPTALLDGLAVVKAGRLFCHSRDRELWLRR